MSREYYLIQSFDSNIERPVDVSNCPVDSDGNVNEKDAMMLAIEQLGWIFCAKETE